MTANAVPMPEKVSYPFDPTYGYDLDALLRVESPPEPPDFVSFWQKAFVASLSVDPLPELKDTGKSRDGWRVFDLFYQSTGRVRIGGWLLLPERGRVKRAIIVSHGYGGRLEPDFDLAHENAALLFPCCRGLGRSQIPPVSPDPVWHVLHDIDKPDRYILRGCVEDIWLAVATALRLFPQVEGRIGFHGVSFGGGIGAMALAWDKRIRKASLRIPSFGNQELRLMLPTLGSGASVQEFAKRNPAIAKKTLSYYDAALAARHIQIPVLCGCARFDPSVAPPGQFSIFNNLAGKRKLFVLEAGHHSYLGEESERTEWRARIRRFFRNL